MRKHEKCQRHRISSKALKNEEQDFDDASGSHSADSPHAATRVIGHRRVHANAARHVNRHGRYENIMLGAACVRLVPRRHSSRRHENAPALAARRAFSRADRGSNDAGVSRCASFPLHFSLLPPFLPYPRGGLRLSCDECWPIAREAFCDYGALSIIENREWERAAYFIDFSFREEFIVRREIV